MNKLYVVRKSKESHMKLKLEKDDYNILDDIKGYVWRIKSYKATGIRR